MLATDLRAELLAGGIEEITADFDVETMHEPADAGVESRVSERVRQVYAKWGKVDILIDNSAIRRFGPVQETTPAVRDEILSANPVVPEPRTDHRAPIQGSIAAIAGRFSYFYMK